ncbi:hypothetical protein KUV85_05225 [Nocardioides panacisoli]|uniref:hypothetical protein n=1 Tax=Nocardioides panacisoli TaxID=627624 RepID=UPI001C62C49C|nr:hypothetical protein [Nocardioides panacisoli]QYJ05089.1 hypothetical protein KUV85_05225 [Nocardioides panacisoli]
MGLIDPLVIAQGLLLPSSVVQSGWFAALAAFVAINTLMYTGLAIAKMLPKVYITDYDPRRRRRAETRSIHPDGPVD